MTRFLGRMNRRTGPMRMSICWRTTIRTRRVRRHTLRRQIERPFPYFRHTNKSTKIWNSPTNSNLATWTPAWSLKSRSICRTDRYLDPLRDTCRALRGAGQQVLISLGPAKNQWRQQLPHHQTWSISRWMKMLIRVNLMPIKTIHRHQFKRNIPMIRAQLTAANRGEAEGRLWVKRKVWVRRITSVNHSKNTVLKMATPLKY